MEATCMRIWSIQWLALACRWKSNVYPSQRNLEPIHWPRRDGKLGSMGGKLEPRPAKRLPNSIGILLLRTPLFAPCFLWPGSFWLSISRLEVSPWRQQVQWSFGTRNWSWNHRPLQLVVTEALSQGTVSVGTSFWQWRRLCDWALAAIKQIFELEKMFQREY